MGVSRQVVAVDCDSGTCPGELKPKTARSRNLKVEKEGSDENVSVG